MSWTEIFTIIGTLAGVFIAILSYFRWAIMAEFKALREKTNAINEKLGNHITETNGKIDELKKEQKETKNELSAGLYRLDKKFDDLYKFLLANHKN